MIKKLKVTKEFVKKWAEEFYHYPFLWDDLLTKLKQMLKEAGIEVEK